MDKQKVLIIKIGYSEILDKENNSRKVSLGDVLRTTPLLHLYKNDHVTWVTDKYAFPLLENNPFIDRLLPYDLTTILQLQSEEFDTVINLEKVPGICALADNIKAWKRKGFRFDSRTGDAEAYEKSFDVLAVSANPEGKKYNQKTCQELLFEMVDSKWKNEEYILGYKPITAEIYDIGLNTQVGQKWPTKSWPKEYWDKLERLLEREGFRVSRQDKQHPEVLTDLNRYIDWINSCKLIISNDSLGLHLGIALKKKVIGLFGPTPPKEIYFYGRGKSILPEMNNGCLPCFMGKCLTGENCMEKISLEKVHNEVKLMFDSILDNSEERNKENSKMQVDGHKLLYHPERVGEWREKGDCYPVYVEFGLTNNCNHKCVFCALDFLEKGFEFIDKEIMISTLRQMGERGVKSVMFAGEGEPLLHPDIILFVQKAKEYGMDVSITTNGAAFTDEKIRQCLPLLSWVRFSVDSGSPENYARIHGTNSEEFNLVINNIKKCVELKREMGLEVTIGVQFLVIPQNKGETVKLTEVLKRIGADNLQIKPYSQHPSSVNRLVVNLEDYNKLETPLKKFDSDNFKVLFRKATAQRIDEGATYPKCYGLPFFALIDARGNIIPCNLFYGNDEFTYGNLYQNSFSEIWQGEKRKEIIRKIHEVGVEKCRHGCRLDSINRYLHRLKNPQEHDNFV